MIFSRNLITAALVLSLASIVSCGKRDDHLTDPNSDATFIVDKDVKIWGKVVVTRDAQEKPNQKDFKIQACLKDKALLAVIQDQEFKVIAGDQEMVKRSDLFGCIIWDEQIKYDAFDMESELMVIRRIEAISGHSGGVNFELSINPWVTEETMTVTDLRTDSNLKTVMTPNAVSYGMTQFQSTDGKKTTTLPSFAMVVDKQQLMNAATQSKRISPSNTPMRLDAIQMNFLGHDYGAYEITPTLNLKVAHKYRIRINPLFGRSSISGKQFFEPINSGKVKFHLAILKDTVDQTGGTMYKLSDVLSSADFVGQMERGVMVADVTLKFQDLAALTGRTILVLSGSPVPGYIQFRDSNYISPVGPLVSVGSISFVPSNISAEVIHQNNLKYIKDASTKAKTISNFDFFKKTTGFTEVPRSIENFGAPRSSVSTNHYDNLMKALAKSDEKISQATKSVICSYLTQQSARGPYYCDSKTMELINFRIRDIVEDITTPVPYSDDITFNEDLTINMNYLLSKEQVKGKAQAAKYGYNAGLTAGLVGSLNAGLDLDMAAALKEKKFFGFGFLSWLSKAIGNTKPGEPKKIDAFDSDPAASTVPGDPVPIPPKQSLGAKAGANLGATVGGVASYNNDLFMWNLSEQRRETGSISTSVKFTANAEMKVFKFKGKFRKCWLVNLSNAFKDEVEAKTRKPFSDAGLPKGLYACAPKAEEGERKEMFVLINTITGIANSPMTDALASKEAPLRMFFRGPIGYSVFKNLVVDRKMEVQFNKFPVNELIKDVQSLKNEGDMFLNQEFPGVLNPILE